MKIEAVDKEGRTFVKEVEVIVRDGERLLSFGFPILYSIDSPVYGLKRDYPFDHDICIDGAGRNHRGSPVYVRKDDMNKIFEELIINQDNQLNDGDIWYS